MRCGRWSPSRSCAAFSTSARSRSRHERTGTHPVSSRTSCFLSLGTILTSSRSSSSLSSESCTRALSLPFPFTPFSSLTRLAVCESLWSSSPFAGRGDESGSSSLSESTARRLVLPVDVVRSGLTRAVGVSSSESDMASRNKVNLRDSTRESIVETIQPSCNQLVIRSAIQSSCIRACIRLLYSLNSPHLCSSHSLQRTLAWTMAGQPSQGSAHAQGHTPPSAGGSSSLPPISLDTFRAASFDVAKFVTQLMDEDVRKAKEDGAGQSRFQIRLTRRIERCSRIIRSVPTQAALRWRDLARH